MLIRTLRKVLKREIRVSRDAGAALKQDPALVRACVEQAKVDPTMR
jgi:hypothetical protein